MKVVLTGGGTGGSVTCLLAIAEELRIRDPRAQLHFIGTKNGPERQLVEQAGITFSSIRAGKLRRYFSLQNVVDPLRTLTGCFQAYLSLRAMKPDVVVGSGSFVSVPVLWAARLLGIPSLAHQLDLDLGLANKLVLSSVRRLTLGFQETQRSIKSKKVVVTGNPYRKEIVQGKKKDGIAIFNLHPSLPTILVVGGGTGALRLNQLVASAALRLLDRFQILHLTGKGKGGFTVPHPNYHTYEFLTVEMAHAYAVADLVISRAGLSTLTELSLLGKPSIIIPIPNSHQVRNAEYFKLRKAVCMLHEDHLSAAHLVTEIEHYMTNVRAREELGANISRIAIANSNKNVVNEIVGLLK